MNFGDCPYEGCDGVLVLEVPARTPAYAVVQCPECGRDVWYEFSRVDPKAWTVADFEAEHEVDQVARTIKRRNAGNERTPLAGGPLD